MIEREDIHSKVRYKYGNSKSDIVSISESFMAEVQHLKAPDNITILAQYWPNTTNLIRPDTFCTFVWYCVIKG